MCFYLTVLYYKGVLVYTYVVHGERPSGSISLPRAAHESTYLTERASVRSQEYQLGRVTGCSPGTPAEVLFVSVPYPTCCRFLVPGRHPGLGYGKQRLSDQQQHHQQQQQKQQQQQQSHYYDSFNMRCLYTAGFVQQWAIHINGPFPLEAPDAPDLARTRKERSVRDVGMIPLLFGWCWHLTCVSSRGC